MDNVEAIWSFYNSRIKKVINQDTSNLWVGTSERQVTTKWQSQLQASAIAWCLLALGLVEANDMLSEHIPKESQRLDRAFWTTLLVFTKAINGYQED